MNVMTMKTKELIRSWMSKSSGLYLSDDAWDELYRRCKGEPIRPNDGGTGHYDLLLNGGSKVISYRIPCNISELDKEFIETSPQPTDGLAFEPSDELDAATLAT